MADDDSFDPRNWGGTQPKPAALPEAWAAVAQASPTPPPVPPASPRASRRALYPFAASFLFLASGGLAAWATRQPPAPASAELATDTPDAVQANVSSRSLVLAGPSDLMGALTASGLSPADAAAANAVAVEALGGVTGELRATLNLIQGTAGTKLDRLEASFADGSGAIVSLGPDGQFQSSRIAANLTKQIVVKSGELDSTSFYSSAVSAGVIDTLIPDFINAFQFDFNLAAEINPGDTFEVAYEQTVNAEGAAVGIPRLLFASLTTPLKRKALYRYTPAGEEAGWYDGNGASTVRSFMRTPVDGARITSKFGPRFHPTLRYNRLHGGTDFAAPVGTPIYAAAAGSISSASPSGCAGNMVIMRHDNGYETRYFHLQRYADGMSAGTRANQGITIGYVGNTGTCTTGPHLHYEVHIDGQKVDPLGIQTDAGRKALEAAALAAFIQQRDRVDVARARQAQ